MRTACPEQVRCGYHDGKLRRPNQLMSKRSHKPKQPQSDNADEHDDSAFVADVRADVEERARRMAQYDEEQAELERITALAEALHEQLQAVGAVAPQNPLTPRDEIQPFDSAAWALQIVDLATAWKAYHDIFGQAPLPKVSPQHGHDAAYRIFACACRTLDQSEVAARIEHLTPELRPFGRTVYTSTERFNDGVDGLRDYFELVAHSFWNSGGQIWTYDSEYLPGKILSRPVGAPVHREAHAHSPRVSAKDEPPTSAPKADASARQVEGPHSEEDLGAELPDAAAEPPGSSSSGTPPLQVPKAFAKAVMANVPADGSWVHREKLLTDAGYNEGGRYCQRVALMARPSGPLESHTHHGYRLRVVDEDRR